MERQFAAQQREERRLAVEATRQAKADERQRKLDHVASQERATATKTARVTAAIAALDRILSDASGRPAMTFDRLRPNLQVPTFAPRTPTVPVGVPQWSWYAPVEPHGVKRWFGGMERHRKALAGATASFEAATAVAAQAERDRQRALEAEETAYRGHVESLRVRHAAQSQELEQRRIAFLNGEPEAVEWFVGRALADLPHPDGIPRDFKIAYRPEVSDVVVEIELPQQNVIPPVREYRYNKTRDSIDPVARPITEIRQRYARLIASVALRTLFEAFRATPDEVVTAVVFNGRVTTTDRGTGRPARPHLISVEAERSAFNELVLTAVEPAACLKHLNALVSPNPFDMEAVEPFIDFDLKRFRFVDADADAEMAGLDSRRNLLKLTPTEFEHLVKDLFVAMGAEAWRTVPSKDGGVDAVAQSRNLFFGGICLVQAKRWTGVVGLDAVHALTGVMTDHNATTGVLVTTSWFSRTSEQFAQRNRITLINGAELKHLINEHLGYDVVPGTTPPRRLNASDNRQTGKPGPAA